jgi:hypothetical protein
MAQSISIPAKWKTWTLPCSNSACNRTSFLPGLSRRHAGICMGKEWFCTADCFEDFLRAKITATISSRQVQDPPQVRRMPLGLLLLSRGILTSEQLALALEKQRAYSINLGDAVQILGFATPEQVTSAVAAQWSCPVFTLGGRVLSFPVHVPRLLLERYELLPVHFVEADKRLTMGFVSRVHYQILAAIEHITGCDATPCFITTQDYRRHLQSDHFQPRENEIIFDSPVPVTEIAHLSRNYVCQLAAKETRFGMCRDYLWIRIWGRQQEIDLLFRVQQD